jgi:hypothetical protein
VGSKGGKSLSGENERLERWEGELRIVSSLLYYKVLVGSNGSS